MSGKGKNNSRRNDEPQNDSTTTVDMIMLSCQPLAYGRPLGHRGHARQEKIAVALDRVTLSKNINNSRRKVDVLIALTSSQGKSVRQKKISRQSKEAQKNCNGRRNYSVTESEENSSSSRQSHLDQNTINSRQNDDVLIAPTSSQGDSEKKNNSLDRVTSRRTTTILDRTMLIRQPVVQGNPLGHRAQPRRKKIAVALDKVTWIRTSTVLDSMMVS